MFYDRTNNFVLIIPDQLNHEVKDLFLNRLILSFKKFFDSKLTIMSSDGIVYNRILFL